MQEYRFDGGSVASWPLTWPDGLERTTATRRVDNQNMRHNSPLTEFSRLTGALTAIGATDIEVNCDRDMRWVLENQGVFVPPPVDPGVVVTFSMNGVGHRKAEDGATDLHVNMDHIRRWADLCATLKRDGRDDEFAAALADTAIDLGSEPAP